VGPRGHFFAAAAQAMRRIVVETPAARSGPGTAVAGSGSSSSSPTCRPPAPGRLLALDEALGRLEQFDPVKARLVTLRYFAGMTIEQAAAALDISRVTAHRDGLPGRAPGHLLVDQARAKVSIGGP